MKLMNVKNESPIDIHYLMKKKLFGIIFFYGLKEGTTQKRTFIINALECERIPAFTNS